MGRREQAQRHDSLLRELNEERAAALMRISRRLESLLEQLQAIQERLAARASTDVEEDRARHAELREEARRYRWYLEVQREALGLLRHERLDEFYPIPGPLTDRS